MSEIKTETPFVGGTWTPRQPAQPKKPSKLKSLLGKIKIGLGQVGTQIGIAIGEAKFDGN